MKLVVGSICLTIGLILLFIQYEHNSDILSAISGILIGLGIGLSIGYFQKSERNSINQKL